MHSGSLVGLGLTLLNIGIQMRGDFGFSLITDFNSAGEVTQVDGDDKPFVDDTGYMGGQRIAYVTADPPPSSSIPLIGWIPSDLINQGVPLILMIVGWMVVIRAVGVYVIAKKTERIINAQPAEERYEYPRASIEISLE
ncbi:hypothetical protein BGX28_006746 [Mortierella sp. GBA30]|nr:hypothetical protein BGX28_006746 [Mortierella sp. GBA30]